METLANRKLLLLRTILPSRHVVQSSCISDFLITNVCRLVPNLQKQNIRCPFLKKVDSVL